MPAALSVHALTVAKEAVVAAVPLPCKYFALVLKLGPSSLLASGILVSVRALLVALSINTLFVNWVPPDAMTLYQGAARLPECKSIFHLGIPATSYLNGHSGNVL